MPKSFPPLTLDAVLLLAILFPMTFVRWAFISAHDFVLPYHYIGFFRALAYVLGVVYLLVAYFSRPPSDTAPYAGGERGVGGRTIVFAMLAATIVIAPMLTSIGLRWMSGDPARYVHDNPIQVEEAAKFLLQGINPYAVDYTNTPMGRWPYTGPTYSYDPNAIPPDNWDVNPALYHVVSLPFGFLAAAPLQALFSLSRVWFDARILYLLAYLLALWLVNYLIDDPIKRLSTLIVVGLNPLLTSFLVEGRNDILVFSLLLASAVAWQRGRLDLSGVLLGLAITTKHIAILFLPFYALLGWEWSLPWRQRLIAVGRHLAPTGLTALAVILPFLLWNPPAFIEDTFGYLAGTLATSYPLSGVGLGGLVVFWGWVPNSAVPFPTFWLQLLFSGPLLLALLWRQLHHNTVQVALASYGLFLMVYMWFARFFFDNYIGYIVLILTVAAFWPTARTDTPMEVQ